MTAVDVDALDKLREAATAGPWSTDGDGVVMARFIAGDLPPLREPIAEAHRPDAALIVAAVNALPDLLAEVRRGRARNEVLKKLIAAAPVVWNVNYPVKAVPVSDLLSLDALAVLAAVDGGGQ